MFQVCFGLTLGVATAEPYTPTALKLSPQNSWTAQCPFPVKETLMETVFLKSLLIRKFKTPSESQSYFTREKENKTTHTQTLKPNSNQVRNYVKYRYCPTVQIHWRNNLC